MNQRICNTAKVLGILTFSAATTFGLHQVGEVPWLSINWSHPGQWLDTTPPIEALLSTARLLGLGCGWWILLSTCFYLGAGLCRATAALRAATPVTLPFIRTLTTRLAMGAVAASTLGNAIPAMASTDRPAATGQLAYFPVPLALPPSPLLPPTNKATGPDHFLFPLPSLKASVTSDPSDEAQHPAYQRKVGHPASIGVHPLRPGDHYRITPGDHMWNIAQRALAQAMPYPPTNQQIVAYWVDLIEANAKTIRSGNPDLLYPHEVLFLPPIRNT